MGDCTNLSFFSWLEVHTSAETLQGTTSSVPQLLRLISAMYMLVHNTTVYSSMCQNVGALKGGCFYR